MITQASFYTYRSTRFTSGELLAEVRQLTGRGDHDQAAIRDIEMYLTRGHEHFNARRYHAALKDYLEARLKIYALLDADAPSTGGGIVVPVNPGIFDGLLTEMVERVRRFQPVPRPTLPGPVVNPPVNVPVTAFSNLGVTQIRPQGAQDPGARINAAVGLARAGDFQRAETQLNALVDGGGVQNQRLRAAALENLGTVLAHQGATDRATTRFHEAARLYDSINSPADAARVEENRAAMLANSGNVDGAISALGNARARYESAAAPAAGVARTAAAAAPAASGTHLSAAMNVQARANQLQHIRDRGSFLSRVVGRIRRGVQAPTPPAMELHYREVTASGAALESAVEFAAPVTSERRFRFLAAENPGSEQTLRVLEYPLAQANLSQQIRTDYYTVRQSALTLEALGVGFDIAVTPGRFEVDLPHHYHFTIQVALAKTYAAIGRFEDALAALRTARTYPHLNAAIEAPFLWIETARVYLTWGNQLYRLNDRDGAAARYRAILVLGDAATEIDAASELYQPALFSSMRNQVLALIPALTNPAAAPGLNPQLEAIVREAYQRQLMIRAQLNFYGVPSSPITIFRFRYLEAVARYFADQAIRAERDFINFLRNSEQETQAVMQLEQAVELAEETKELEERRVQEAVAMVDVAQAAVNVSDIRLSNTIARRNQYAVLGRDLIALDTATAHASGGFTETEGGYDVYLNSAGGTVDLGDQDYIIMRNAAARRGEISYELELANLDRAIAELQASRAEAVEQLQLAQARVAVAQQGVHIADVRIRHANENLEYAQNKTFTAELWANLAGTMREITDIYLQRAVEVAHLMQSAYNFEFDQNLTVIATSYTTREELAGLLAADLLKTDIDYFTYHRITQVPLKRIPTKVLWSVAERYPFKMFEFRRTGILQLETLLADFDELYPGAYLSKLKAVEVVFEGLIGADGIHGRLTNDGVCKYRTRAGAEEVRLQPRETMLLSVQDLQRDSVIFRPSEEARGVFEDAGFASQWTLEVPRGTSDLNYGAIRDIRIVFYVESFHDEGLAALISENLPDEGTWQRSYSLATEFPDAFFRFQDTGELAFDVRATDFPLHHTDLEIESITLLALPGDAPNAAVRARLQHAGAPQPDEFQTDAATGIFASDPPTAGNPLNAFVGGSPLVDWVFSMNFADNPNFVDDGGGTRPPRITGLRDVIINIQYAYERRTAAPLP